MYKTDGRRKSTNVVDARSRGRDGKFLPSNKKSFGKVITAKTNGSGPNLYIEEEYGGRSGKAPNLPENPNKKKPVPGSKPKRYTR